MDFTQPNDGIIRDFIFEYKCPNCSNILQIKYPLIGASLYLQIHEDIKCENCSRISDVSEITERLIRVYRHIIKDFYNNNTIRLHKIKIFLDSITACFALVMKADGNINNNDVKYFKEFCKAYSSNKSIVDYGKDRLKFFLKNQEQAYINLEKLKNNENKLDILETLCELSCYNGKFSKTKKR